MKNILPFAKRNLKEILRDPLSLVFGAAMPVILMIVFQIINNGVQNSGGQMASIYKLDNLVVGLCVFSFSFVSLYTGLLIAKDRETAFLSRVFVSPMRPVEYILGYLLPLLLLTVIQSLMCITTGFLLDLIFNSHILVLGPIYLLLIIALLPIALVMVSLGVILGCTLKVQSVGGLFALFVQIIAFTGNIYFPIDVLGNVYLTICKILPFYPAVSSLEAMTTGVGSVWPMYLVVLAYAVGLTFISILVFKKKMKE